MQIPTENKHLHHLWSSNSRDHKFCIRSFFRECRLRKDISSSEISYLVCIFSTHSSRNCQFTIFWSSFCLLVDFLRCNFVSDCVQFKFTFSNFSGYRHHFGRFGVAPDGGRCQLIRIRGRLRLRKCHSPEAKYSLVTVQVELGVLRAAHDRVCSFEFAASLSSSHAAPSAPASGPAPTPTEPYITPQQRTYGKGPKHRKRVRRAAIWYLEHEGQKDNSFAKVAAKFDVKQTTLRRHVDRYGSREAVKPGHSTTLSDGEELALVMWILFLARCFFPPTKQMVLEKAQELAQVSDKTFKNSLPSQKWWSGFKARNPEIRLRKLKAMSSAAKQAASRDVLDAFYADLDSICKEYGIGPERTFNMDESGLENLGGRSNVVVGSDQTHATSVVSTTNEHVTIIACVNALGTIRLPPLFLFQGTEGGMPKNHLLPGCPDNWMAAYTGQRNSFVVHLFDCFRLQRRGGLQR